MRAQKTGHDQRRGTISGREMTATHRPLGHLLEQRSFWWRLLRRAPAFERTLHWHSAQSDRPAQSPSKGKRAQALRRQLTPRLLAQLEILSPANPWRTALVPNRPQMSSAAFLAASTSARPVQPQETSTRSTFVEEPRSGGAPLTDQVLVFYFWVVSSAAGSFWASASLRLSTTRSFFTSWI
jgi:hypothetical protein